MTELKKFQVFLEVTTEHEMEILAESEAEAKKLAKQDYDFETIVSESITSVKAVDITDD